MRILLIVPAERTDWYDYLSTNEQQHEYILLWQEKASMEKPSLPQSNLQFSKVICWSDYATPQALLRSVAPDKIIFFEIVDLRQIALIVSARAKKITTFYMEHGAAGNKDTAITRWAEVTFKQHKIPYLINRFRKSFFDVLRSKFFYYSGTAGFNSLRSYSKYLGLPIKMLSGSPNKVLSENTFRERVPTYAVVFNRINYGEFKLYTDIPEKDALFTGVPFFDKYFRPDIATGEHVVFIDHPYLEESILGWTSEHHAIIANSLFQFAEKNQLKLFIKLHPRSDIERWNSYKYNPDYISIVQQGDFTELYLAAKLILGFSSTLITGFLCAHKNVVLLGWHPEPQIFGMDFSQTGLCHASLSPDDLNDKYDFWQQQNLSVGNTAAYDAYLKECNYPFDGKAAKRICTAINTL